MKRILPYILAFIMLLGTFGHFASPESYLPFIPPFFPANLANILAGLVEGVLGIALLIPRYRSLGGLGFMLLMIIFFPLHVWDLLKEEPAIGSRTIAIVRVLIQFLLIYLGWYVWKKSASKSTD